MTIAIIGIGLMGQALGEHLLAEKQSLVIYNRHADKTQDLVQRGAHVADSAQQAIEKSDFILLFLSDASAIDAVFDNVENEALANKTVIQMATIAPEQSRVLAQRIEAADGYYLECPVLGSLPEARTGSLILMAAGSKPVFESALPVLELIGKQPRHFGNIGQGATVKLAMNQLIAGLTSSFSLSLALVEKEGVDVEQFMSVVRESALYAPTYDKKLDRMITGDFSNPNFPTKHLDKDTRLFLDVAENLGLNTSALAGIASLLEQTLSLGLADTDYSAIYAAVNPDKLKAK